MVHMIFVYLVFFHCGEPPQIKQCMGKTALLSFNPPLPLSLSSGDNLVLKWQLLSELLACSVRMVSVRSSSGAVHEAKLQCLEALKLATKLQALSQYVHCCGCVLS